MQPWWEGLSSGAAFSILWVTGVSFRTTHLSPSRTTRGSCDPFFPRRWSSLEARAHFDRLVDTFVFEGVENDRMAAYILAEQVMDIFGFEDAVCDEWLTGQERRIMVRMENHRLVWKTRREVNIGDTSKRVGWRIQEFVVYMWHLAPGLVIPDEGDMFGVRGANSGGQEGRDGFQVPGV